MVSFWVFPAQAYCHLINRMQLLKNRKFRHVEDMSLWFFDKGTPTQTPQHNHDNSLAVKKKTNERYEHRRRNNKKIEEITSYSYFTSRFSKLFTQSLCFIMLTNREEFSCCLSKVNWEYDYTCNVTFVFCLNQTGVTVTYLPSQASPNMTYNINTPPGIFLFTTMCSSSIPSAYLFFNIIFVITFSFLVVLMTSRIYAPPFLHFTKQFLIDLWNVLDLLYLYSWFQ